MSDKLVLRAKCPKCGNRAFQQPARLDVDATLTCPACKYTAKLAEFSDSATRDDALQLGKKALREAFKNVPGFKPKP